MIKNYINNLVTDITGLDQIERFGGWCELELQDTPNGSIEAGIRKETELDCHGNTYTPDDRFASVGFVFIDTCEMRPSEVVPKTNELLLTIGIKIYYTPSKTGSNTNHFEAAVMFNSDLNKLTDINGKKYSFSGTGTRVLHKFGMVTLRNTVTLYVPCDYVFTPGADLNC